MRSAGRAANQAMGEGAFDKSDGLFTAAPM
jgi:hypothetical protein